MISHKALDDTGRIRVAGKGFHGVEKTVHGLHVVFLHEAEAAEEAVPYLQIQLGGSADRTIPPLMPTRWVRLSPCTRAAIPSIGTIT